MNNAATIGHGILCLYVKPRPLVARKNVQLDRFYLIQVIFFDKSIN
jgi:hypothetical protein